MPLNLFNDYVDIKFYIIDSIIEEGDKDYV